MQYSVTTTTPDLMGSSAGSWISDPTKLVSVYFDDKPTAEHPTNWLDIYTAWNFLFVLEFTFLRAVPLAILFLPTLLASGEYWALGRVYSLFLAIHALIMNFRDGMAEVSEATFKKVGASNAKFGAVLLRKFGLNSTNAEAFRCDQKDFQKTNVRCHFV